MLFILFTRVLILLNSLSEKSQFSEFFDDLGKKTDIAEYHVCSDQIFLEKAGFTYFDTLIVMSGKNTCFSNNIQDLWWFLNNTGNIIIFVPNNGGYLVENLFSYFNLSYSSKNIMQDMFGSPQLILNNIVAPESIISKGSTGSIIYRGGFGTLENPNEFRFPLILGGFEHFAKGTNSFASFLKPALALQSRTGSRAAIFFSDYIVSNEAYHAMIWRNKYLTNLSDPMPNYNRRFMNDIMDWLFHKKSEYIVKYFDHCDYHSKTRPQQYVVEQSIYVSINFSEIISGEEKLPTNTNVMVELFMQGVFIRKNMNHVSQGFYESVLKLPNKHGNYKLRVFTQNIGYNNINEETFIAIRPYSIKEKRTHPSASIPYKFSVYILMIASVIVYIMYMFNEK